MYKIFLTPVKKSINPTFKKIIRIRPTGTHFMHTKFDLQSNAPFRRYRVDSHPHTSGKIAYMNSRNLKTYKCVKISKMNFLMTTIFSLHSSMCSESKNKNAGDFFQNVN